MRRTPILILALVAVAVMPEAAQACAVCFDASDENRQAFLMTTAFMSLFPLGMVGGAGLWLRRRVRERDEDGSTGATGAPGGEPDTSDSLPS